MYEYDLVKMRKARTVDDMDVAATTITRRTFDAFALLSLDGHFDFTNGAYLEAEFNAHGNCAAVVSLEGLKFADCSVLGALVRLHAATRGELAVVLPHDSPVARLFALTQMEKQLRLVPDRAAAIALVTRAR